MAFDFGNNEGKRLTGDDLESYGKPFLDAGGFSDGPSVSGASFSSNDSYPQFTSNPLPQHNPEGGNIVIPSEGSEFSGFKGNNGYSRKKTKIKPPKPPRQPIDIPWKAIITIAIVGIIVFVLLFHWDVIEAILANLLAKIIVIAIFVYIIKLLIFGGHRK